MVDITNLSLEDFELSLQESGQLLELDNQLNHHFQQFYISDDPPTCDQWCLPLLVGLDKNNKVREWQIYFNRDILIMQHGLQNMKKPITSRQITTNTSGRDLRQQGWLEACERYNKMLRKCYRMMGEPLTNLFKVMRATIYSSSTTIYYPVWIDYKMDGHRCYISYENGEVILRSSTGILLMALNYLNPMLLILFNNLPPGSILDSEIYTHGMSFEDISSIIRTRTTIHPRINEININLFDVCWNRVTPFERRRSYLERAMTVMYTQAGIPHQVTQPSVVWSFNDQIELVDQVCLGANLIIDNSVRIRLVPGCLAYNSQQLDYAKEMAVRDLAEDVNPEWQLDRGYEGIMIKRLSNGNYPNSQQYRMSAYHYARCAHIYKYKPTSDMEGLCIGVEDSKGTEAGCAVLVVSLRNGNSLSLRMKGSLEMRRQWMENTSLIVGKVITFKYHRMSDAGIPIHAVGMRIRCDMTADQFLTGNYDIDRMAE